MNIKVGDLVHCRDHGQKVGLVICEKQANEGLTCSKHTQHIMSNIPSVYYVFFSGEGRMGPYHRSEIQSVNRSVATLTCEP